MSIGTPLLTPASARASLSLSLTASLSRLHIVASSSLLASDLLIDDSNAQPSPPLKCRCAVANPARRIAHGTRAQLLSPLLHCTTSVALEQSQSRCASERDSRHEHQWSSRDNRKGRGEARASLSICNRCPWPIVSRTPSLSLLSACTQSESDRVQSSALLRRSNCRFLHDTVPKNLTSCFKNADFLDFFYARLKPNPVRSRAEAERRIAQDESELRALLDRFHSGPSSDRSEPSRSGVRLPEDWSDALSGKLSAQLACALAKSEGYDWISPCMGELNFIRAEDAPIVYKELVLPSSSHSSSSSSSPSSDQEARSGAHLLWAGTRTSPFDPTSLFVHPATGRLYTRAPRLSARRSRAETFGEHALLSSALVLQHFAHALDIDDEVLAQVLDESQSWSRSQSRTPDADAAGRGEERIAAASNLTASSIRSGLCAWTRMAMCLCPVRGIDAMQQDAIHASVECPLLMQVHVQMRYPLSPTSRLYCC